MATAEALALGALALPLRGDEDADSTVAAIGEAGYADHPAVHVRLSGQDSNGHVQSATSQLLFVRKRNADLLHSTLLVCSVVRKSLAFTTGGRMQTVMTRARKILKAPQIQHDRRFREELLLRRPWGEIPAFSGSRGLE